jgi:glycine/D-amino acid oxidase-like deaminating enzyme
VATGGDHAVVVGAGIAGLTAARAISAYFDQVTIVESDELSSRTAARSAMRIW